MAQSKWESVVIKTDEGEAGGIAPVIISASRSTDIPAFYPDWFMSRLQKGYVKWVNPFNARPQYVSLSRARVFVFWTKDAEPFVPYLKELDSKGINYYFTFTVNDYENEGLEPGLRSTEDRAETFRRLSGRLGRDRVIWRYDPLILTDRIDEDSLLDRVFNVGRRIAGYTDKLVISFADISAYPKVVRNMYRKGINFREFTPLSMESVARGISEMNKEWGLEIATCCEEIDLGRYGIKKNRCVDGELMSRLFPHDKELMEFLGHGSGNETRPGGTGAVIGAGAGTGDATVAVTSATTGIDKLKDKGQRLNCGCIMSKDIGRYDTCGHRCIYCYANSSPEAAAGNHLKYLISDRRGESILP